MSKMTATFGKQLTENGYNYTGSKEMESAMLVIGIDPDGKLVEIASMRIFVGRSRSANRVYASLWVHGKCAGHGWAGGHGYHKASAALQDAINNAGIGLSQPIDGRGEQAMKDALRAIGEACGYEHVGVYTA